MTKLSDVKVRAEVWLRPEDEKVIQRHAERERKTRAGWMRDVILEELRRRKTMAGAKSKSQVRRLASQLGDTA